MGLLLIHQLPSNKHQRPRCTAFEVHDFFNHKGSLRTWRFSRWEQKLAPHREKDNHHPTHWYEALYLFFLYRPGSWESTFLETLWAEIWNVNQDLAALISPSQRRKTAEKGTSSLLRALGIFLTLPCCFSLFPNLQLPKSKWFLPC